MGPAPTRAGSFRPGAASGVLAPAQLVRILGWASVLGSALTLLLVATPHDFRDHDEGYVAVGVYLLVLGGLLVRISRRDRLGRASVHGALAAIAAAATALTWLGMPDVGGVQSVLLVVMLGISALVGPTWWSAVFTAILSAAYAVVLATSGNPSGFDKAGQWQIVTTGMVVCVAFAAMVRRELEQTRRAEHERQAERDRERELHAERLERLNESLREASELKSSFVAMASHELRTPLTSIEGFASTMRYRWNELSDADKLHFVEVIDSQASRLGRLVTDLLTVSKIEAGRVVAHREPTALEPAIRRAVEAAPGTPGELVVECDATAPAALVDPDHLQQMLLNYLANARAYAAPPITLVVADEGATVRIEVRDSGPGVDATFAPRLFDRFTRSPESARSDDSGGTGLGLSIVQGLAVSNGGEAWFEPGDPSGATFCLRLPVA